MSTAQPPSSREQRPGASLKATHLLAILFAGALLRVLIAYVLLPADGGFAADLTAFRYWTSDLVAHGPWGMYGRGYFLDYLPGYLLTLWPVGALSGLLFSGNTGVLVKLPALIGDLLLVVGAVRLARDLGASPRAQTGLAALLAIAPMTWLDSAVWGQVDSVGTAVLLFAASDLVRGKTVRGAALAALAAVIKPQFGILIPLIGVLAFIRARRSRDMWSFVVAGLAGAATVAVAALPFGLNLIDVVEKVVNAASSYPYLSVNAWNPWALIATEGKGLTSGGTWGSDLVALPYIAVPGLLLGSALLIVALSVAARWVRRDEARITIAVLACISIAFFVLPTRVHERYLYPAIPLTMVLAAVRPAWRPVAALVSLHFLANTWSVLTLEYFHNVGIPNLGLLAEALHTPVAVVAGAAASVAALALATRATRNEQRAAALTKNSHVSSARSVAASPTQQRSSRLPYDVERSALAARATPRLRLGRVDVWLLIAVAVAALLLRGFRLGEPSRFQFDEVYHVRTATEFLQDWRYGEPHAIYEYTHPHLAKYAIALGIELFGAPTVDSTTQYRAPVTAIAARGASGTVPGRIWVATSSGIDILNSESRTLIGTLSAPNAVAIVVDSAGRLWASSADGTIYRAAADLADTATGTQLAVMQMHLSGVHAIAVAQDDALLLLAGERVVRVQGGVITNTAQVAGATDLVIVATGGTERVIVSGSAGLTALNATTLDQPITSAMQGGATALAAVTWFDSPRIYAAGVDQVVAFESRGAGSLSEVGRTTIAGATQILANDATRFIHVVAPGPNNGPLSVWSVEPNGNARFEDVAIGGAAPTIGGGGVALDTAAGLPGGGAGKLFVAHADGAITQVSVGNLPFGWRWPGVLAGALAAALLVLLARLLTDRRDVAAIVAVLALIDGAGFVQSRIGMNDVYLLAALLAAASLFVAILQRRISHPLLLSAALGGTGLLLGLALASKWVAVYGAFGLGVIWLARTRTGRALMLLGLLAICAVLLPPALAVGADAKNLPNLPAALVAVALAAGAAAAVWRADGVSLRNFAPRQLRDLISAPAEAVAIVATLVVIPLGVYLASYLPWVALGNRLTETWPPGNAGQTLADLTASMYRYHDTLRVAHAASSPWWAWPFDLKPVWFFQADYPSSSASWTGAVYDGGNGLSRWLGVGGTLWIASEAWRRRSWGLASVLVLYLALWLPWARVDRAAFEYHYYPSSQIALIALALLLADLRAGSERAVKLVRRTVAVILVALPALWALVGGVCALAGVASVYPASQVCLSGGFATPGPIIGAIALVPAILAAWSVLNVTDHQKLFRGTAVALISVAVIWYPNWSDLPLPTGIHNWYQGLLPTWTWPFQFGVTLEKPVDAPLLSGATLIAGASLVGVAAATVVLLSWWRRRRGGDAR